MIGWYLSIDLCVAVDQAIIKQTPMVTYLGRTQVALVCFLAMKKARNRVPKDGKFTITRLLFSQPMRVKFPVLHTHPTITCLLFSQPVLVKFPVLHTYQCF